MNIFLFDFHLCYYSYLIASNKTQYAFQIHYQEKNSLASKSRVPTCPSAGISEIHARAALVHREPVSLEPGSTPGPGGR